MLSVSKEEGRELNDIGIATIPTPVGWSPNRSGGKTAAIFSRKGADPKNLDEMISIDIGTATTESAKGSADGLAKKFGGEVAELPFAIDGEIAFKVSIAPDYEQMRPRECIVTHHNSKVCFIFGASKTKDDIWPAVSEIAKSFKWN